MVWISDVYVSPLAVSWYASMTSFCRKLCSMTAGDKAWKETSGCHWQWTRVKNFNEQIADMFHFNGFPQGKQTDKTIWTNILSTYFFKVPHRK